jgi:hypothetical protein
MSQLQTESHSHNHKYIKTAKVITEKKKNKTKHQDNGETVDVCETMAKFPELVMYIRYWFVDYTSSLKISHPN